MSIELLPLSVYVGLIRLSPIQAAARSKAWVCGRSLAAIEASNPAGGMEVCLV